MDSKDYVDDTQQALNKLINTISLEQSALNSILDTEKDMLQRAFGQCSNMFEFMSVNDSVNSVVKNIVRLQTMMQIKFDDASDLLQKSMAFYRQADDEKDENSIDDEADDDGERVGNDAADSDIEEDGEDEE